MKRLAFAKCGYYVMSVIFYIFGLAYIFLPDLSAFWLSVVCGLILITYGAIKLVGYLSPDLYQLAFQYDMASAILFMIVGFVVLLFNVRVTGYFKGGLGFLILFDSVLTIQTAKDAAKFGIRSWVLLLVISILCAICGVMLIVFPMESMRVRHAAVGLSIFLEGLMKHCVVLCTVGGGGRKPGTGGNGSTEEKKKRTMVRGEA